MVRKNKYHIQFKRTDLELNSSTIQGYEQLFGEPVYINKEDRLTIGPVPAEGSNSTPLTSCKAIKFVSQSLTDPDDSSKQVTVVDQGVHFKDFNSESKTAYLTNNVAEKIYPITKMSAVLSDGTYELSEYLLHKLNIDRSTLVIYPSLGVDANGVYVDDFDPVPIPNELSINSNLASIVNSKVSIDDESAIAQDLAMGVDLIGVYVRMPDGASTELDFIKTYIDYMLNEALGNRLLALEGNIYYLQELLNNISFIHVGATPPTENNKLWIDTTTLTGGLKYCSNKAESVWSHVPVAYT